MTSRTWIRRITRALLAVCGLLALAVLLAAMPGRRTLALPQQEISPALAPAPPDTEHNGAMQHDPMPGMDLRDEKSSEGNAVNDMLHRRRHVAGPHLQVTPPRPRNKADEQRAAQLAAQLREALAKYRDYHAALADGYKIFLPNVPQPEYHFTNYWHGFLEALTFDPARPTSLLYKKTSAGYELAGAMYTMPKSATEEQLNERVPLSVAQWHLHTNLCLPSRAQKKSADWTRFGLHGSISTQRACDAAGGRFRPSIFGWMVHVYPFEDSQEKIFGMR
ncbi:MAG: hypothetical protein LAN84_05895 [Acidobacteriia bacterium]|nr:hypothetical protein [Terriglobia bacterium]